MPPWLIATILGQLGWMGGEALAGGLGRLLTSRFGPVAAAGIKKALAAKGVSSVAKATEVAREALPAAVKAHVPETAVAAGKGIGRFAGSAILGGGGATAAIALGDYLNSPSQPTQTPGAEALLGAPVGSGSDLSPMIRAVQGGVDSGDLDPNEIQRLLDSLGGKSKLV